MKNALLAFKMTPQISIECHNSICRSIINYIKPTKPLIKNIMSYHLVTVEKNIFLHLTSLRINSFQLNVHFVKLHSWRMKFM